MAKVVYEYTDDAGRIHRVEDIREVPQKYVKKMTAVGVEDGAPPSAAPAQAQLNNPWPTAAMMGRTHQIPPAVGAGLCLLTVLLWRRVDSFFLKMALLVATAFWLFTQGFNQFMTSDLVKTDAEIQSSQGKSLRTW
ncbi:MAG: hypothetical protein HY553_10695 [Elusimicrobia bacterium]|nr:hypothetical protein [Elusimicrobiota bacterium]